MASSEILRMPEVIELVGMSKMTIWRWRQSGSSTANSRWEARHRLASR